MEKLMNKKLMAAAVAGALAIPGMAFAQSSVTLYGTIDGGIRNQSKVLKDQATLDPTLGDGSVTSATDGLYRTNRWGMHGSEDLGGGLKANFKLEGQYSSDTGAGPSGGATFARSSWVGLSSGASEFHVGRDYTVNFKTLGKYDPMGYNYTGIMPNAAPFTAGVRSSNMIQASTGFNGAHVMLDYALGEAVGSSSEGRRIGIGGDFSIAGATIAAAYSTTNTAGVTPQGKTNDTTIGGRYSMNGFTFRAGWAQTKWDVGYDPTNEKARMLMLGAAYDFSSRLTGRVGYYDIKGNDRVGDEAKYKTTILAIDYDLSKRTTAYVEIDHHALSTNVAGVDLYYKIDGRWSGDGSTGVGVGIAHTF
jgi:predicted porin